MSHCNDAPVMLTTQHVAAILDRPGDHWTAERARRWLKRTGAAVKRGGRYVTTPSRLADSFPEVWRELVSGPDSIEQYADVGDFRTL